MTMENRNDNPVRTETPLLPDLLFAMRYYLRKPRVLAIAALALVGMALLFSWGWLVALGVAPFLLAVLPCAAMCALGMCMNHGKGSEGEKGGGSCSTGSQKDDGPDDSQRR